MTTQTTRLPLSADPWMGYANREEYLLSLQPHNTMTHTNTPQRITTTEEVITPEKAREYLALNTHNRPVSCKHVDFLAKQMRDGEWKRTGETIVFSENRLLDGQNRLHAVVKSGETITFLVVRGVSNDAFDSMGACKSRSGADVLAIAGYKQTKSLVAAVKIVENYFSGIKERHIKFSNSEILALAKKYDSDDEGKSITSSVNFVRARIKNNKLAPHSVVIAAHYIFKLIDGDQADKFMDRVFKGVNLAEGDPERLLRERLMRAAINKTGSMDPRYVFMLFIKCWNYRRQGKFLRVLKFVQDGESAEEMPVAI